MNTSHFSFCPPRDHSHGFTLLELLLVLGIIAVMAIAAFVIFPKVQAASKARTEVNNITAIAASVRSMYNSVGDYSSLTSTSNNALIAANIFPSNMNISSANGGTVLSTFSQPVVITSNIYPNPDGSTPSPGSMFDVIYNGVPSASCARLATEVGAVAQNVFVSGYSVFSQSGTNGPYKIDPVAAASKCSDWGAAPQMVFVFQ